MNSVNFVKVKKGALGRVNSARLYAFNATLKKDALTEKSYWELYKNSHPLNRYWWNSWLKRQTQYDSLIDKERAMPVDQKFKVIKYSRLLNIIYFFPIIIACWFVGCYLRYRWFGTTTADDGVTTNMYLQGLAKVSRS